MPRRRRLFLPFPEWPAADKSMWMKAFAPGADLFDEGGLGAHLSKRTICQLQYAYGKFLCFILDKHADLFTRSPAERVNAEVIAAFAKWQPARCGGVTLSVYIYHLWLALRYLCPGTNWSWLLAISNRIKAQARPKPEKHHLVTSETLYDLGIELMDGALSSGKLHTYRHARTAFRDGLIIAFLAMIPLRRRTLTALRVGKQLIKCGDDWALEIPAEDVKTKRPLDFSLPPELSRRIDIYLDDIRPRIRRADTHDYLWATSRGPMPSQVIYDAVRQRTRTALGLPVNLHQFRRAAATLWSVRDPENVRGAKDLLGHASFATTEKHYIMAHSRLAGRVLARTIREATGERSGTQRSPRG